MNAEDAPKIITELPSGGAQLPFIAAGADFSGVDLRSAENLNDFMAAEGVTFDRHTKIPDNSTDWMKELSAAPAKAMVFPELPAASAETSAPLEIKPVEIPHLPEINGGHVSRDGLKFNVNQGSRPNSIDL